MSSGAVLDASAVLAPLFDERGGEEVVAELDGSMISAVNWAEVIERAIVFGMESKSLRSEFERTGARVVAVEAEHTEYAARLHGVTRPVGLSLADRICFALAVSRGSAVVTADRAWAKIDLGVEVRLIR